VVRIALGPQEMRALRVRAAELELTVAALLAQLVRRELEQPAPESEARQWKA